MSDTKPSPNDRCVLERDDSCHWYLIREEDRDEFGAWVSFNEDPDAWHLTGNGQPPRDFDGCRVNPYRLVFTGHEAS